MACEGTTQRTPSGGLSGQSLVLEPNEYIAYCKQLHNINCELSGQVDALKKEKQDQDKQIAELWEEVIVLQRANLIFCNKIRDTEREHMSLTRGLGIMKRENEEKEQKITDLEEQSRILRETNNLLQQDNDKLLNQNITNHGKNTQSVAELDDRLNKMNISCD